MLPFHQEGQARPRASTATTWRMPAFNGSIIASIIWVFLSICLIGFGSWHCGANSYQYSLHCDNEKCLHKSTLSAEAEIKFLRNELHGVNIVRVDGFGVVAADQIDTYLDKKLGYSLEIEFEDKNSPHTDNLSKVLLTPHNMGKKVVSKAESEVKAYKCKSSNRLSINNGRKISSLGALSVFVGFISLLMSSVFGVWPSLEMEAKKIL